MNPFETPPSGDPVAIQPPTDGGRNPFRLAAVAVLTAALIVGGAVGVSALVSTDRPAVDDASAAPDESTSSTTSPDEDTAPTTTTSDTDESDSPAKPPEPAENGQLVIDDGDGDPIVIDFDDLDPESVDRLIECIGLPEFDFDLGTVLGDTDMPPFEFGDDLDLDELLDDLRPMLDESFGAFDQDEGNVVVTGPDGVSVVDLGDDGSVTITRRDGTTTIDTDGDATVSELSEIFGDLGSLFDGGGDVDLEQRIDDLLERLSALGDGEFPDLGGLPDLGAIDPDAVEACLADVLGR